MNVIQKPVIFMCSIMPNLILTNKCLNKCPYCFSNSSKVGLTNELSIEEFEFYLNLIKKSKCDTVKLIGGDPFLFPEIEQILKRLIDDNLFNRVVLFSTGFIDRKFWKILTNEKIQLNINLNEPRDYDIDNYRILKGNIVSLADNGVKIYLGYNIYREDFNGNYNINLTKEIGVDVLRWSVAVPSGGKDKFYFNIKQKKNYLIKL